HQRAHVGLRIEAGSDFDLLGLLDHALDNLVEHIFVSIEPRTRDLMALRYIHINIAASLCTMEPTPLAWCHNDSHSDQASLGRLAYPVAFPTAQETAMRRTIRFSS